jgi:hypothetical protein
MYNIKYINELNYKCRKTNCLSQLSSYIDQYTKEIVKRGYFSYT